MAKLGDSEEFCALFYQLRDTIPEPKKLDLKRTPDLLPICQRVNAKYRELQIKRAYGEKVYEHVAPEFYRAWEEYEKRFKKHVDRFIRQDFDEWIERAVHEMHSTGNIDESEDRGEIDEDEEIDEQFNPLLHNPAKEFEALVQTFLVERRELEEAGPIRDRLNVGLEAWQFFREVLSLDIERVWDRWCEIADFDVPRQVSGVYGQGDPQSLTRILRQAQKAYTFDCPLACIALCRAALEVVIMQHYAGLDKGSDKKLGDVIGKVQLRYSNLQKENMVYKKKQADRVLHSNELDSDVSKDVDVFARDFVRSLRVVIGSAPLSPGRGHFSDDV